MMTDDNNDNNAKQQQTAASGENAVTEENQEANMFLWVKVFFFVLYFIFSIATAFLILFHHPTAPSCRIKMTYQQKPMTEFLADPYYASTGILRGGPKSLHEVLAGTADAYSQLLSDVAAFPVGVEDPIKNSPFLPIQFRSLSTPWTLESFMSTAVGRNLGEIINHVKTNSSGYDPDDIYNNLVRYLYSEGQEMQTLSKNELRSTLAIVRKALEQSAGTHNISTDELMNNIVAHFLQTSSDITFFLEEDGAVTFPASYGSPKMDCHDDRDNQILLVKTALLGKGLMGTSRGNSMVPNFGRCLKDAPTQKSLTAGSSLLQEMVDMVIYSHRKGSCLSTGQPLIVDITSNPRTSLVLFSSNSVIFFVCVITWITASFYLVSIINTCTSPSWEQGLTVVLGFWYLIYAVFLLVFALVLPHIPTNNVFLGLGLGLLSFWYQFTMPLQHVKKMEAFYETGKRLKNSKKFKSIEWSSRSQKVKGSSPAAQSSTTLMHISIDGAPELSSFYGQPRHRNTGGPQLGVGLSFPNYKSAKYAPVGPRGSEIDKEAADDHEWVGMAITWPLVFVSMACSASPYVTTYSVQQLYAATLAFYLARLAYPKGSREGPHNMEVAALSVVIILITLVCLGIVVLGFFLGNLQMEKSYGFQATTPILSFFSVAWLLVITLIGVIRSFRSPSVRSQDWAAFASLVVDEILKLIFCALIIAYVEYGSESSLNNSCRAWKFDRQDIPAIAQ